MTDFAALRALVFAAECFFGASLILAAAWFLAREGSAAQRHMVWLVAFAAMLILPVAAALTPARLFVQLPSEAPLVLTQADLAAMAALPQAPAAQPLFTLPHAVMALFIVWLIGVAVIAAQLLTGLIGVFFLHRRSVGHIPNGIDGTMFRGPRWQLRLRTMPGNEGPVTYGIFKPTVLLPKASVRWSRARLQAVLLHEFAHVCRRDSLARLIALMACAFYWPNPFAWSAAARLKHEAEIAADDAVLSAGVRASSYAEALVGLAREYEHTALAGVTLPMAERSTLKDRIQSVLSPARSRMGVTRMDMLKIAACGMALTAGLVLVRPSLAEAKPQEVQIVQQALDAPPPAPDAASEPDEPDAVADEPDEPDAPDVEPVADAAPDAPPVPPAPPVAAAPAVPPLPPVAAVPALPPSAAVPADRHHAVRIIEFNKNGEKKVWKFEGDPDEVARAMAAAKPEFDKAMLEAHKAMADARIMRDHMIVINRGEIDQAVSGAMKARHHAMAMNKTEMRKAMREAQRERVKALEESRAEIDRELAEARREADTAERQTDSEK